MSLRTLIAITEMITGKPVPADFADHHEERAQAVRWGLAVYASAQARIQDPARWLDRGGPELESARLADGTWCACTHPDAVSFTTWGALQRAADDNIAPDVDHAKRKRARALILHPYLAATVRLSLKIIHSSEDRVSHAEAVALFVEASEGLVEASLGVSPEAPPETGKPPLPLSGHSNSVVTRRASCPPPPRFPRCSICWSRL